MKVRNAMQLKAFVNNYAIAHRLAPQLVLQNYYLQRFLERLSLSPYRENFIVKGGVLVSSLLGLTHRMTMDIDATAIHLRMSAKRLHEVVSKICEVSVDDDVKFEVVAVGNIADHNDYPGLRVELVALQPPMKTQLTMDVTMGDSIVPKEVETQIPLLFEDRTIDVMTYPIETLLAEKLQTILVRGATNTRARDFYDIHLIQKMKGSDIRPEAFRQAFIGTCKVRKTEELIIENLDTITRIEQQLSIQKRWFVFQQKFDYARDITFAETIHSIRTLLDMVLRS